MRTTLLLLAVAACASEPAPTQALPAPAVTTRSDAAPIPSAASTPTAAPAPSAEPNATVQGQLVPVGRAMADDGQGGQGWVDQAVAVDIDAQTGWPGEAMEPSLQVGELRFVHYQHVSPTTLRFVVADAAAVPVGAQAVVRYGDREHARFVIAGGR